MWKVELSRGNMLKVSSFTVVYYVLTIVAQSTSIPLSSNHFCPVPTTNSEFGNKVLDLHEIKGHKVRLQFFYPSEEASRKLLRDSASADSTTWSPFNNGSATDTTSSSSVGEEDVVETTTTTEKPLDLTGVDVYCQWTFKAANESQFLSLTFEKLSAPYSDNCAQAFVALQKENGYESRWCGNRRQANARPMSLLARSSAVVTVYRSGNAPLLPVTGFKVSVRELDFGSLQGAENSLRVLLG